VKFTGSIRHLFERVDKKRIPPTPEQAHNRRDNRRVQRLHETSRFCTVLVARLREPGGRPAGFPLWPFRNWGILLHSSAGFAVWGAGRRRPENACVWGPRVGPQKNHSVFGVPRVRAMKNPARFPGPGLGTLLKDIFLYMNPVSTSRSHRLHRVTSCTTHSCIRHPKKYLLGTPPLASVQ
jgi:hypothetical protein